MNRKTPGILIKLHLIFFIILFPFAGYSQEISIGKIVSKTGIVRTVNINCSSDDCKHDKELVYPGDRFATGYKSGLTLILNDGTAVELFDNSVITVISIVNNRNKTLTEIISEYGRFKVIQNNDFFDASLVIKTGTAIVKSVCSTIDIAAAKNETGIFVYKGEAGFANIDPAITEAFIIKSGFESFLKKDTAPSLPVNVRISLRTSWLTRHFLSKDMERLHKYNKNSGAADWFFIEKKQ